ncbi:MULTISPECIES: zinc-binding alcohol dehydrogenase family protein [Sorangium]|uniref:Zinc-type alcohol dehydrogenase-like protein n=1 Tax=Sorangium cellulosum (strain So ce56) TaxID=448385 RepID=A9GLL5_SORC5|nr:zinc-binding alcohol dehydrogenase family protein [Sorangium cellulosum]CAN90291.1 alcohol dehydrogenase, zinc-containing [Sorangium cellulosum So ce56]
MHAVGVHRYLPIEHPESLLDLQLPEPAPRPRDLRVRVCAVAVNPVDVKVRAPKPRVESPPRVLGWDAAGIVEAVGADVTVFRPGDKVYYAGSIARPGSNAEVHLVDERLAAPMPRSLGFADAAALPLTSLTAWEGLFERLGVDPEGRDAGSTVLVLGGAGGVGSMVVQLAKAAGLRVVATASREESRAWARSLGADVLVDHRAPLRPQLEAAGIQHVELIFDTQSTEAWWDTMADLVAPRGRIVGIVEAKEPLDLGKLMSKSATFAWELMFTRSLYETADMAAQRAILTRVAAWVDEGRVRTTRREHFGQISAANLRAAHARIESGQAVGKLVLEGWG